ncbi:MAG: transposase [Vulcanimicrobiota bacterium]
MNRPVIFGWQVIDKRIVTNITGKAGRSVLKAVASGERDPHKLEELTRTGLKAKPDEIIKALENSIGPHQRLLLQVELKALEALEGIISELDAEVDVRMRPFEEVSGRIDVVPGFTRRNAQEVLGIAGPTMEDYPSAGHLAAWAGLCPGNSTSAGKTKRPKARRGRESLKCVMVEAAWAAIRTKGSYWKDLYHRKKATRGSQKAIVAVAHALLVTIYHMVRRGTAYQDLGADYHKRQNRQKVAKKRVAELSSLGFDVQLRDLELVA